MRMQARYIIFADGSPQLKKKGRTSETYTQFSTSSSQDSVDAYNMRNMYVDEYVDEHVDLPTSSVIVYLPSLNTISGFSRRRCFSFSISCLCVFVVFNLVTLTWGVGLGFTYSLSMMSLMDSSVSFSPSYLSLIHI